MAPADKEKERLDREALFRQTLAAVAPGTDLRDGLERILRGGTGGLIVLGHDRVVDAICSGGFTLDLPFSATHLRELAKMDGAVVLSTDLNRILRANVQLVPDPALPTSESGTRHRTAERTARQTGYPVLSVSQSMNIIVLYLDSLRYPLEEPPAILSRANQALATLERYKQRLDEVAGSLSALEIEDLVAVRDVVVVAQRMEMVRRIAAEIEGYVLELGTSGRLLALQLEELVTGLDTDRELLIRDYLPAEKGRKARTADTVGAELEELSASDLIDLTTVAKAFGYTGAEVLELALSPRGFRLLGRVPRLPAGIVDRLVEHFDGLQQLLAAGVDELQAVDGVGESRARTVREGLSRMAESSILERYV
jgi:diadenylate cyclase